jgi:hypothetical protein
MKIPDELRPQFEAWASQQQQTEKPDTADLRQRVKQDLDLARKMSVKEYTLWQKWDELRCEFADISTKEHKRISGVADKIWQPAALDDYLKLEPELVFIKTQFPVTSVSIWGHERFEFVTNPDPLAHDWEILRLFVSTMPHGGNVGRSLRFLVRDRVTKKYLGVICISSDFFDLAGRDKLIGWSNEIRTKRGMINHTAIGSVIVPTQPFGFNYVGGKLLALLCLSKTVADMWEEIYGYRLVGVTTTSLYGETKGKSQYDDLKHWKACGFTPGQAPLKPAAATQKAMRDWLRAHHPEAYWRLHEALRPNGLPLTRNATTVSMNYVYRQLGFTSAETRSQHSRGIYFARLYDRTYEFLQGRTPAEKLRPLFDNSEAALVQLWRDKYAAWRVKGLAEKGVFSQEPSFYDGLLGLSWDQAKERYLTF